MLIRPGRSSGNLIDRRGGRGGRGVGLGIGGLVILLVGAFFGLDLQPLLGGGAGPQASVEEATTPTDDAGQTVDAILVETEDVWGELYRQSGETYPEPNLVLYEQGTPTGCGYGQAAAGPFYCPSDQTVYMDLSFFRQLRQMGAEGDFPLAYVIAHEVAHHIQNVEGALSGPRTNTQSVQTELQADCFAGVWAHHAEANEAGRVYGIDRADIQEAMSAAAAVGDDRLQRQAGQAVRPETFTHGTSEQRVDAFLRGYHTGEVAACA